MTLETKTDLQNETIDTLQDLVRINVDAAQGFETAADNIENDKLATMFRADAGRRRDMARELKTFVELNEEDVALSGSLKGKLHRWWIDLRGTIQDGDEHAILAEAERGEDVIKGMYEKALKSNPGTAVSDVLHAHMRSVKETHDRVRDLRDAFAKANG